jgi:hypothetical protein
LSIVFSKTKGTLLSFSQHVTLLAKFPAEKIQTKLRLQNFTTSASYKTHILLDKK